MREDAPQSRKTTMQERVPPVFVEPPAVESLIHPENPDSAWPREILNNPELRRQAHERQGLDHTLRALYKKIPKADTTIDSALAAGVVSANEAEQLYTQLTKLLTEDPLNKRFIFYMPFEFLPRAITEDKDDGSALGQAQQKFKEEYLNAWHTLLYSHDVRANFVDGDVMDDELRVGDHPRVVQAAHMIPKLIEAKILTVKDTLELLENTDDPLLQENAIDALEVLNDLGYINATDQAYIQTSKNECLEKLSRNLSHKSSEVSKQLGKEKGLNGAVKALKYDNLVRKDTVLDDQYLTDNRRRWLLLRADEQTVEAHAPTLAELMTTNPNESEAIKEFVTTVSEPVVARVFLRALEDIISTSNDPREKYSQWSEAIESLSKLADPTVRDELERLHYHLYAKGYLRADSLATYNIPLPGIEKTFQEQIDPTGEDFAIVKKALESAAQDPELMKDIYPVMLFYGSKIKGYGKPSSDIDIAVFVKPGTDISRRSAIQKKISTYLDHPKLGGKGLDFWLTETPQGLTIKDFEEADPFLGGRFRTHTLFGSAWFGNQEDIEMLHQEILAKYLQKEKSALDFKERPIWVEEIERHALQYRLLHQGYRRFYPPVGLIETPHAQKIDGSSTFWDSGYRRMATLLYVNKVFLPNLSETI